MNLMVEREEVWAATIEDRPGGLANKLAVLAEAGADLDFMIARRLADRPGTGVVFVTPLRGDREVHAATQVGFSVAAGLHSVRVSGMNEPGLAAKLTRLLANAGLNLRGASGAVIGPQCVLHFAFDSEADANRAMQVLQAAG